MKSTGTSTTIFTVFSTAAPRRLRSPLPGCHSLWPNRRHHSLSQVSKRGVHAHGLKLPGEAQPMSVRRCTYRTWAHPRTGRPKWSSWNRMQTRNGRKPASKRVAASSSTSDPDSDPGSDSSSSSAMESSEAAGVHGLKSAPSSDPECGPNRAIFCFGEKCEKTSKSLIRSTRRVRG